MGMKGIVRPDPSKGGRTKQEQTKACDVNLIVAHHRRGGVSTHVMNRVAEYGFAPALDFQTAMNEVRKATELFAELPAATRDYFRNDPARFVNFAAKPEQLKELVELGLVVEKVKPSPVLGSAENPIHTAPAAPGGSGTGAGGTPA